VLHNLHERRPDSYCMSLAIALLTYYHQAARPVVVNDLALARRSPQAGRDVTLWTHRGVAATTGFPRWIRKYAGIVPSPSGGRESCGPRIPALDRKDWPLLRSRSCTKSGTQDCIRANAGRQVHP